MLTDPDSKKKNPQLPSKGIKMSTLKLGPFLETEATVYVYSKLQENTTIRFLSCQMQTYRKYQDIFNVSPLHVSPVRHVEA